MSLTFNLGDLLRSNSDVGSGWQQGVEQGYEDQQRAAAAQKVQKEAQDKAAARTAIAHALATGDLRGAATAAYAYGQDKTGEGFYNLTKFDHDVAKDATTPWANVAAAVGQEPYESRRNIIQAMKPRLAALGIPAAEIDSFDPTDANLVALSRTGYSIGDAVKDRATQYSNETGRQNADTARIVANKPIVLAQGSTAIDPQGNIIASAPSFIETKPEDTVLQVGGQSGGGAGRYSGGWTPRARNGGDNTDAAVDGKIMGASRFLGVSPTADISHMSPLAIAQAMTLSEGGPGSLAARNHNPANIRNPDKSFKRFPTREAGLQAAAELVARKLRSGQTTVKSMIEGLPQGQGGRTYNRPILTVQQGIPKATTANGDTGGLTPEALDWLAQYTIRHGGQLPPGYGRNKNAMVAISNRVAQLQAQGGVSTDAMISGGATTKADTASLQKLEGISTQVRQAENAARLNAGLLLQTSARMGNGSNQWINSFRNRWFTKTGDPNIASFNAALETFASEYATVMARSGQTTDSLRAHVHDMINTSQGPDQLQSVVRTLQADMHNRIVGLDQERARIRTNLGMGGGAGPASGIVDVRTPADAARLPKGTRFRTPDGRVMERK